MIEEITLYLQDKLNEEQALQLWGQLLFDPYWMEMLEFYLLMQGHFITAKKPL